MPTVKVKGSLCFPGVTGLGDKDILIQYEPITRLTETTAGSPAIKENKFEIKEVFTEGSLAIPLKMFEDNYEDWLLVKCFPVYRSGAYGIPVESLGGTGLVFPPVLGLPRQCRLYYSDSNTMKVFCRDTENNLLKMVVDKSNYDVRLEVLTKIPSFNAPNQSANLSIPGTLARYPLNANQQRLGAYYDAMDGTVRFIYTDDEGETWDDVLVDLTFLSVGVFHTPCLRSDYSGIGFFTVKGGPGTSVTVYRTADHGITWDLVHETEFATPHGSSIIYCSGSGNNMTLLMSYTQYGRFIRSTDGGQTWSIEDIPREYPLSPPYDKASWVETGERFISAGSDNLTDSSGGTTFKGHYLAEMFNFSGWCVVSAKNIDGSFVMVGRETESAPESNPANISPLRIIFSSGQNGFLNAWQDYNSDNWFFAFSVVNFLRFAKFTGTEGLNVKILPYSTNGEPLNVFSDFEVSAIVRDDWSLDISLDQFETLLFNFYKWRATYSCSTGWSVEQIETSETGTITDWEFVEAGIYDRVTESEVPPPPSVTPTCFHYWSAIYNCTNETWAITLDDVSLIGAISDWAEDSPGEYSKVTDSNIEPAPPAVAPTCYYSWSIVYDCIDEVWVGPSLDSVSISGTLSDWEYVGQGQFNAVTDSSTPPSNPATPPECNYLWYADYNCSTETWEFTQGGIEPSEITDWVSTGLVNSYERYWGNTTPPPPDITPTCYYYWSASYWDGFGWFGPFLDFVDSAGVETEWECFDDGFGGCECYKTTTSSVAPALPSSC